MFNLRLRMRVGGVDLPAIYALLAAFDEATLGYTQPTSQECLHI